MAALEARDLVCVRGERVVFAGLGFRLQSGEALTLVGANGSGKSSLLRLLAGLLRAADGELLWNDNAVAADIDGYRRRLRYVGHLDPVKPVLSVRENLEFWARLQGAGTGLVEDALARFGLDGLADVPGRLLSAGQRRRLNLARLIAGMPAPAPLWLLDEPTSGLDAASVATLEALLAFHREAGGLVVVATHTAIDLPGSAALDLGAFGYDGLDDDPDEAGEAEPPPASASPAQPEGEAGPEAEPGAGGAG
ncbi:MAG TPA: heme ABC exporter ATP-binding protein CcmA [Alphaproteobacteria bacterium]|nr:heme ABC exporter ATP-binding protein CcmA [Alphaproteobacteria bacterium]